MNSLVAGRGSRTRAGLASLSAACCGVAIVTGSTALAPRPGRVVETLLWGVGEQKTGLERGAELGGATLGHFSASEAYHTAARLGVADAGVTVALAPLAGAQVEAGAGAGVAFVALLQGAGGKKYLKKKKRKESTSGEGQVWTKREMSLFHCSTEIVTLQLSSKTEVG